MSNVELENFRMNRFFLMAALGDAMSLDEVNELLNSSFKKCLLSPTFQINIDKSKHIMTLMNCGYIRRFQEHPLVQRERVKQRMSRN